MVNRIDRLYSGPSGPVTPSNKPNHVTQATEDASTTPVRQASLPLAARLIPNLEDTVEISEAGREAARAEEADGGEEGVAESHRKAIANGWYAAGYLAAQDAVEKS